MTKKIYLRTQSGDIFATEQNLVKYHPDCEVLPHKKGAELYRQAVINQLRGFIVPGSHIYTEIMSVSRSGMNRTIRVLVIRDDREGKPYISNISDLVAVAIGQPLKNGAVSMGGCGMDMCFALTYSLGRALFPDGFGIVGEDAMGRKIRPLTKEKAEKAVANGFVFRGRNGDAIGWDDDGGYALSNGNIY